MGTKSVLGLDVGGANLKAATADGRALCEPFPLWREPHNLHKRLRALVRRFRPERLAVTMTGELCDCFATRREGVNAILDAVVRAADKSAVQVWNTRGSFVSVANARQEPWRVAAANWHALATYAGRFASSGPALLIDIGSTTTDIIPLRQGKPAPQGWTDPERLATNELVYTGVVRTPVCAVMPDRMARELFATMRDVYLILNRLPEEPGNRDTADGRPATRACAHARLARMQCADTEEMSSAQVVRLAHQMRRRQVHDVACSIQFVTSQLAAEPTTIVLSGVGEFLAREALQATPKPHGYRLISLTKQLSPEVSTAACAYALAVLAEAPQGCTRSG